MNWLKIQYSNDEIMVVCIGTFRLAMYYSKDRTLLMPGTPASPRYHPGPPFGRTSRIHVPSSAEMVVWSPTCTPVYLDRQVKTILAFCPYPEQPYGDHFLRPHIYHRGDRIPIDGVIRRVRQIYRYFKVCWDFDMQEHIIGIHRAGIPVADMIGLGATDPELLSAGDLDPQVWFAAAY